MLRSAGTGLALTIVVVAEAACALAVASSRSWEGPCTLASVGSRSGLVGSSSSSAEAGMGRSMATVYKARQVAGTRERGWLAPGSQTMVCQLAVVEGIGIAAEVSSRWAADCMLAAQPCARAIGFEMVEVLAKPAVAGLETRYQ